MPTPEEHNEGRALDAWARREGYANFPTYMAAGGTMSEAHRALTVERQRIDWALTALHRWHPPAPPPKAELTIHAADLARAEAEVIGDPVDPDNTAIQGYDDER
jgi:hypothetical protein